MAEKSSLESSDEKFIKTAGMGGMAEVKLAELGTQKASSSAVKEFAEMIVKDHTAANAELKKLADSKGVELSAVIDPKHAEKFQKLEKYSGADFDKEFTSEMVSGHKTTVSDFESAAKNAKDGEVKAFADKMLPTLRAHLDKAKELNSK